MPKARTLILDFTVFLCGALVMIYEIIGSRILAPYIGTSTYTWTSLIGVILAASSCWRILRYCTTIFLLSSS